MDIRRVLLLLALLPWTFLSHGRPRAPFTGPVERALFAPTVLDESAAPAARSGDLHDLLRSIGTTSRGQRLPIRDPLLDGARAALAGQATLRLLPAWTPRSPLFAGRHDFRPLRLSIPHNATAPPAPQS